MPKIQFSDALALLFKHEGISHYFAVTGGAAVHLIQGLTNQGIKGTFNHHEQGSALAADAYSRIKGVGLCVTTTGPGVTNAITGLLSSWQDSSPTIFLSGQSRTTNLGLGFRVRQSGTQHLNVEPLVQSLVKEFVFIDDADVGLQKVRDALQALRTGRPGPIWIDVPLDVQLQEIDLRSTDLLIQNKALEIEEINSLASTENEEIASSFEKFIVSSKPVYVFGRGVGATMPNVLSQFLEKFPAPIVGTWGAFNSEHHYKKFFQGRIGVSGNRTANKILQSATDIFIFGARLSQSTVGSKFTDFAPNANITVVEIDREEAGLLSSKRESINIFNCGAERAIGHLIELDFPYDHESRENWLRACQENSLDENEYKNASHGHNYLDLYLFLKNLDERMTLEGPHNLVIDGGGTVVYAAMQVLRSSEARNLIISSASAPMGTGLPQAIGAIVSNSLPTFVIVGDGSFMFNLQELQTIVTNKIPITILVLNNAGYRSIRSTQDEFLKGVHLGSDSAGGIDVVNLEKMAKAFGIGFEKISSQKELDDFKIVSTTTRLVEVIINENQEIYPKVGFIKGQDGSFSPAPLDKMYPFV
jgi:acetolactate synthase-1/2/3 large subunit